ncbi:C-terminal, D2-small domain-containing protein, of ClpB protein [Pseudomonas cuatrocienegasensis]|uniref:C-terminal, D2-small domain-containing protein, of ClpB protein n=1 Tax=Pseudomonas cuatrocienegasensis TaxID=543360 RepID=A0ABY1BCL4_9PSED|nr:MULTISPECIES: AAA family ATPase [Pseudomonas]OEC33637.1 AAA family ATPase [Pseudomonas sp. 21C1]SEQ54777.1 C-terminal, D2-small domain-containing protein, of ClpB protein [Pseudomonas cuatrocienegasensis]
MPFANELIEHNRERLAEQRTEATVQSRFVFEPAQVMALLRSRIVGQEAVLAEVEALLKVLKVDISERERPLSVNLFMGPTGVGKTEIVRLLAQAIHGRADAFCRIDMHTLAQEHYAAALTGAPPGYVGSKEGTTLFDAEAIAGSFSRPGIVLFDELEKASQEVLRSLLGILENGQLTLAAGTRTLDFRNSLIFMTSNLGAREASDYRARFRRGWRRWLGLAPRGEAALLERVLHARFEPEWLNRIDRILLFERIDAQWLQALLDIELGKLNQRLSRQGRALVLEDSARAWLCRTHDERFGARDLARRLRRELEPALADCLLADPASSQLRAYLERNQLRVGRA